MQRRAVRGTRMKAKWLHGEVLDEDQKERRGTESSAV